MSDTNVSYFKVWENQLSRIEAVGFNDLQLGQLFRAMMLYQFRGEEYPDLDPEVSMFFMFIREELDFARKKYATAVANGKKGGRKKKEPTEKQTDPIS